MEQLNETQRYFIDEHIEDHREGLISRRELFRRVTLIAGSAALASTILAACDLSPKPAARPNTSATSSGAWPPRGSSGSTSISRRATGVRPCSPTRRRTTPRSA